MALLTTNSVPATGLQFTVAGIGQAVAASDTLTGVDDRTFVVIYNGNASTTNVTVSDPGRTPAGTTASGGAMALVAVPTVTFAVIPISPANVDPATGLATVTCSVTATVRIAAYRR